MMKKIIAILSVFVWQYSAFASVPTVESLFRNVSNPDVEGEVVRFLFTIEEKENELRDQQLQVKNHPQLLSELLEQPQKVSVVEILLLKNSNNNAQEALQVYYEDITQKKVKKVIHTRELRSKIDKDNNIEAAFFYGVIASLGLNDASVMVDLFKKNIPDFKDNQSVLNKEKLKLLEKYRSYLQLVKDNKDLAQELESPFNPKATEEKEKVQRLKNEKMYKRVDNVKLVRIKKEFFWEVNLSNLQAIFSNEKQQLRKLMYAQAANDIILIADRYVLFNGVHELPKLILYKSFENKLYHIKPIKYSIVSSNGSKYVAKYLEDKQKQIEVNKESTDAQLPFLFR